MVIELSSIFIAVNLIVWPICLLIYVGNFLRHKRKTEITFIDEYSRCSKEVTHAVMDLVSTKEVKDERNI